MMDYMLRAKADAIKPGPDHPKSGQGSIINSPRAWTAP